MESLPPVHEQHRRGLSGIENFDSDVAQFVSEALDERRFNYAPSPPIDLLTRSQMEAIRALGSDLTGGALTRMHKVESRHGCVYCDARYRRLLIARMLSCAPTILAPGSLETTPPHTQELRPTPSRAPPISRS